MLPPETSLSFEEQPLSEEIQPTKELKPKERPSSDNIPEAVIDWIIANNLSRSRIDPTAIALRLQAKFKGMEGYADALFRAYKESNGVAKTKLLTVIAESFSEAIKRQDAEITPMDLNDEQLEAVVRFMVQQGEARDEAPHKKEFGT